MLNELNYLYNKIPDYQITPFFRIKHPTYDEIVEYGEEKFISTLYSLCSSPDDFKSELYDNNHIYWNEVDDVTWFYTMATQNLSSLHIIFSSSINNYSLYENKQLKEVVLYDEENDTYLSQSNIQLIKEHLNSMIGYLYKPHKEIPTNRTVRQLLIEKDREQKRRINTTPSTESKHVTIKEIISNVLITDYYEDNETEIRKRLKVSFNEDDSLSIMSTSSYRLGELAVITKIADKEYKTLKKEDILCQ